MPDQESDCRIVHNYISGAMKTSSDTIDIHFCPGGLGGHGGVGREHGTGGGGGVGQGPSLNYEIKTEQFTMNNQYVGAFCPLLS
jgi:hypothetical protein